MLAPLGWKFFNEGDRCGAEEAIEPGDSGGIEDIIDAGFDECIEAGKPGEWDNWKNKNLEIHLIPIKKFTWTLWSTIFEIDPIKALLWLKIDGVLGSVIDWYAEGAFRKGDGGGIIGDAACIWSCCCTEPVEEYWVILLLFPPNWCEFGESANFSKLLDNKTDEDNNSEAGGNPPVEFLPELLVL